MHELVSRPRQIEIELGEPVAFGDGAPSDVVRYAATAVPAGTGDPLERAIVADAALRGLALPGAGPIGHPSAGEGQAFAVTTVYTGDGLLEVARGDPRAVLDTLVRPPAAVRARAVVAAARLVAEAYRPLAVAVRRGGPGAGSWQLLGLLPVRAWSVPAPRRGRPFDYHRVWDLWLRIAHWTWVAAIAVLTVTGYVISDPGWVPIAWVNGDRAGYFLGFVRLIHLLAAVVFMLVLVVRAWNLSTSSIPYDRWRALVPFRSRHQLHNLVRTLRAYLFIRADSAPVYFGHNPLQQLTYTFVYVVFLVQVLTGLALWGLYDVHSRFWGMFQWVNGLLGSQHTRLVPRILLFLPAHVYLSIRADSVERSGAISSMVSGGRWIRRGAVFEDWPPTTGAVPTAPPGTGRAAASRSDSDREEVAS